MKKLIIAAVVLAAVALVQAEAAWVAAKKNETGVYERETRKTFDSPLFTVGTDDRLQVLERGKNCLKVKTPDGETGWVEKRLVKTVSSRGFVFENAQVMGYLDDPTPVFILDGLDPGEDPISLDRSFKDALTENVDRETVCRQVK